jgi:hypothetical protein
MKEYKVALSRAYIVTIEAENEEKACRYAEYFLGHCYDASDLKDKQEYKFSIKEIEPTINDAIDVEEVKEHE